MNDKESKVNKITLQCDCHGMEFVQFLQFTDDDPTEQGLYVTFGGCEIYTLWRRLKMAWRIIRYGEYQNDGVLLWDEKDKLIEWLSKFK